MKQHFTYGFEIEGMFSTVLLREEVWKAGQKKQDLSVKIPEPIGTIRPIIEIEHRIEADLSFSRYIARTSPATYPPSDNITIKAFPVTEFCSPVFETFDEMLAALKMFNEKTFYANSSCGLHIHIKEVGEKGRMLRSFLEDWHMNQKCVKIARRLAQQQNYNAILDRIDYNDFCRPYSHKDIFLSEWRNGEKRRFIRNHPSGTLEFRFFSPLPGKDEFVLAFFDKMFDVLSHKKTFTISKTLAWTREPKKINIGGDDMTSSLRGSQFNRIWIDETLSAQINQFGRHAATAFSATETDMFFRGEATSAYS